MSVYKIHTVTLHADAQAGAVHVPDFLSHELDLGPVISSEVPSAEFSPTHISHVASKIAESLETWAIQTILDETGLTGMPIKTAINPGVTTYLQKFDDEGDPAAGAVHRSLNFLQGIVVPLGISIDNQGHASLRFTILGMQKTTNAPVVISDVAALPTITITSARWTLGKITIAGTVLPKKTGLEISFGNTIETMATDSDVYDTLVSIRTHEPSFTVTGVDPTWLSSVVALDGTACTHANTSVYLRKRAADGINFVADITAEHLKFTLDGIAVPTKAYGADGRTIVDNGILVTGKKDGSGNNPMVYAVAAIT